MVSIVALLILSPLLLFVAIKVRLSSPGPIFYLQERIGLNGVPFNIIKFRSMYTDAESRWPSIKFGYRFTHDKMGSHHAQVEIG